MEGAVKSVNVGKSEVHGEIAGWFDQDGNQIGGLLYWTLTLASEHQKRGAMNEQQWHLSAGGYWLLQDEPRAGETYHLKLFYGKLVWEGPASLLPRDSEWQVGEWVTKTAREIQFEGQGDLVSGT